jgi:hypothetical protein
MKDMMIFNGQLIARKDHPRYKMGKFGLDNGEVIKRANAWPSILLPLKAAAQPGDRGAGDIIARTIGPIGGTVFKTWYRAMFHRDCGCGHRQEILNARWPL